MEDRENFQYKINASVSFFKKKCVFNSHYFSSDNRTPNGITSLGIYARLKEKVLPSVLLR